MIKFENDNLKKYFEIAYKIAEETLGEKTFKENGRKIKEVKINKRAKSRYGCCKYNRKTDECIIEVSDRLLNIDNKELITTLIHELLHTLKDTKGHNYKWKWYAMKISNNTEYNISRTRKIDEIKTNYKYEIICNNCGNIYHQNRMTTKIKLYYIQDKMICPKCRNNKFTLKYNNKVIKNITERVELR